MTAPYIVGALGPLQALEACDSPEDACARARVLSRRRAYRNRILVAVGPDGVPLGLSSASYAPREMFQAADALRREAAWCAEWDEVMP